MAACLFFWSLVPALNSFLVVFVSAELSLFEKVVQEFADAQTFMHCNIMMQR